ncbi:YczE/YyaS/YitT family protein [Krasilnikovia sp. M28-CT-15]|uniref:membrane protein YczE n=1 Tax=Krasilnikovia sp. M28-CT-15 TaxID=3373540 RepID=UPI003877650D
MPATGNINHLTIRFRPGRRLAQLTVGLTLYAVSMALMVVSGLGLTPWDVFHQGVSQATGISIGTVVIITGIPLLLLWIPLRQRPGIGTIANLVVIGLVVDGVLAVLPTVATLPARVAYLVAGILLNGLATGMYIGARLGPGPRDGLMTGIAGRFPRLSIRLVRTTIEVLVLATGFLLGGTVGLGTLAYAVAIGPLAQAFIPMFAVREPGRPAVAATPA